jgi:hypothetical protein
MHKVTAVIPNGVKKPVGNRDFSLRSKGQPRQSKDNPDNRKDNPDNRKDNPDNRKDNLGQIPLGFKGQTFEIFAMDCIAETSKVLRPKCKRNLF